MKTSREEIARNFQNKAWLCAFANDHIAHRFQPVEKTNSHWKSDRESEPAEHTLEYLPEKAIVLWKFDVDCGKYSHSSDYTKWKELVLLESGTLWILLRSETSGCVRSDFEAHAGYHDCRVDMQYRLGDDDLQKYKATIVEALFRYACERDDTTALAYDYWQAKGNSHGSDQGNWFEAEKEIERRSYAAIKECHDRAT